MKPLVHRHKTFYILHSPHQRLKYKNQQHTDTVTSIIAHVSAQYKTFFGKVYSSVKKYFKLSLW